MAPRDTLAPQVRRLDFCKASHSFRLLGAGPHPIHVSHCRRHDSSPIELAGNSGGSSQHLSPQLDNYPEFSQDADASPSATVPRNKAKYGDNGVVVNSCPSIFFSVYPGNSYARTRTIRYDRPRFRRGPPAPTPNVDIPTVIRVWQPCIGPI